MKMKYLAAAVATLAVAQAHATPLSPNVGGSVNTPDIVVYVSGASAQKPALQAVVATAVCQTPADVTKLTDGAGTSSNGWFCLGKTANANTSGKKVLVLYRSKNGSAAGLNQVLSTSFAESEATTIQFSSCAASTSGTSACTGSEKLESIMALSDVKPGEFAEGILTGSGNAVTSVAVGLQGFGIAVNGNLYQALQEQNIADGRLPATCSVGDTSAACQPSIGKADYASLAASAGAIKDAATLLPEASSFNGQDLTLCRRVDTSGTQASSNIFFLNNICGTKGYLGASLPATNADFNASPFVVVENSETADVKSCVNNTSGLRLGVISLENVPVAGTDSYQYVKLDGVSPNYLNDGSADAKQKTNLRNGSYGFAMESYAVYSNNATAGQKAVAVQLANALKASTQDLTGILALTGSGTTSALYKRGGNNCAPLMQR